MARVGFGPHSELLNVHMAAAVSSAAEFARLS